tara:strand:+ start:461 stop:646 length:186 start_codon:yes stop_codon:yes gene_type:complete
MIKEIIINVLLWLSIFMLILAVTVPVTGVFGVEVTKLQTLCAGLLILSSFVSAYMAELLEQ